MTEKEFKKKYNLIDPSVPILHTKLQNFDFSNPPVDPVELAQDLIAHMRYFGGIGLSANQLGLPYRVFVSEGDPAFAVFNPVITGTSTEEIMLDEGCLSYPGLYMKINRPSTIRVRFRDPYNNNVVKKFEGMTARVFQHEYDHLEGIDYLSRVSRLKLERAKEKQKKLIRKIQKMRRA
jgi:peptide deformylase